MKYEWRKKDKAIYLPKQVPSIIDLDSMKYITIEGVGNPNSEGFRKCIEVLYGLSYPIKMSIKKENIDNDYTVFPLEGVWSLTNEGIKRFLEGEDIKNIKDDFKYKLMIRQPSVLDNDGFQVYQNLVSEKKGNPDILAARFEIIEEGLNCQMMHIGPFDDEPKTFAIMEQYCKDFGYQRIGKTHKEIYLSDARKVEPSKLKTTLRFKIEKIK